MTNSCVGLTVKASFAAAEAAWGDADAAAPNAARAARTTANKITFRIRLMLFPPGRALFERYHGEQ